MKRMLILFLSLALIFCQYTATQGEGLSKQMIFDREDLFWLEIKSLCNANVLSFEKVFGAVKYNIKRADATGFEPIPKFKTTENTFLDNSIKESQTYKYQVTAIDEEGKEIGSTYIVWAQPFCRTEKCDFVLEYQAGNTIYKVDGIEQPQMDVAPEITNSRIFLVIRYVTKEVNAEIEWLASEKKITIKTIESKIIELWIGKSTARIDGKQVKIDPTNDKVVPYIKNGRTLMPMRFVAENLGSKKIDYDSKQSLAKLLMRKPNCFEPNFLTFTYEQYDFINGKMVCLDSLKARFYVGVPQDQMAAIKSLSKGDRVLVMPSEAKSVGDKITITAIEVKKLNKEGTTTLNGRIAKIITESELKIIDCENKEVTLKNLIKPMSMKCFGPNDPVKVTIKDDSAIDITRVLMEQLCSQDTESTVLLKVTGNYCEEGIVNGLSLTNEGVSNKMLYYKRDNPEFCSLIPQGCYKVTFVKDPLNRSLLKQVEKVDCPCEVFVGNPDRSLFAVSGDTVVFKYKVTNTDKIEKTIIPILDTKEFKGSAEINPKSAQVESDRFVQFEVTCSIDDEFKGKTLLRYGAKCDNTSNVNDGWFVIYEPLFSISEPMGSLMVPKESPIIFSFRVKNSTIASMNCKSIVKSDDFIGSLSVEPTQDLLRPMGASEFKVRAKWDSKVEIGKTATVLFGAKCGNKTEMKEIRIEALKKGPIVTITDKAVGSEGNAGIMGGVDWNGLNPGTIEINWGDNVSSSHPAFPAYHKYDKTGEYFVQIVARAATGEVGSTSTIINFDGPKPAVTISNWEGWISPGYLEVTIYGSVDWKNFKKKKITFRWDDGSEDVIGDFPQKHVYNLVWYTTYNITVYAEAETGEIGKAVLPLTIR